MTNIPVVVMNFYLTKVLFYHSDDFEVVLNSIDIFRKVLVGHSIIEKFRETTSSF